MFKFEDHGVDVHQTKSQKWAYIYDILIGDQGQGLRRLEKAYNVTRDLFSDYDYSQNHLKRMKHIGVNCRLNLCTTVFLKVEKNQDSGYFQHENHFSG